MIAIPNMKKPESCWGCFCENDAICQALALLKADSSLGEVAFHEVRPDCPLVEIVRCGECKYWYKNSQSNTGGCSVMLSTGLYAGGFCSYGKRRNDETD